MPPLGRRVSKPSAISACGSLLEPRAAMARSAIACTPALSPPSTRLMVTPELAASNFGFTILVQKSMMFWSELVYQSMVLAAAKAIFGIRVRHAAAPDEDKKIRRFIWISPLSAGCPVRSIPADLEETLFPREAEARGKWTENSIMTPVRAKCSARQASRRG